MAFGEIDCMEHIYKNRYRKKREKGGEIERERCRRNERTRQRERGRDRERERGAEKRSVMEIGREAEEEREPGRE